MCPGEQEPERPPPAPRGALRGRSRCAREADPGSAPLGGGRAGHSRCFPRERGVGGRRGGGWLEALGGLGKGVPLGLQTRAAWPLGVSRRPHTHILGPRVPGSRTHHPAPTSTRPSDPVVPTHAAPQRPLHPHRPAPAPHTSPRAALAIPPSRTPAARPRRVKEAWGTGAAGRERPGLIGDPGNNEGCEAREAGGLIGPRSGLAFVWDKALQPAVRSPQPNSGSQLGPQGSAARATPGGLAGGGRGAGETSPRAALGTRASRGPAASLPPIWEAAAPTWRERGRQQAAPPSVCRDPPRGPPLRRAAPAAACGRCCPLVSVARSADCWAPAAASPLSCLDVRPDAGRSERAPALRVLEEF